MSKQLTVVIGLAMLTAALPQFGFQTPSKAGAADLDLSASPLRPYIDSFNLDRLSLLQNYDSELSPERRSRMKRFYETWRDRLKALEFDSLPQDGKIDYVVFRTYLDRQLKQLEFRAKLQAETESYLPFTSTIIGLEEARKATAPMHAQNAAARLTQLSSEIEKCRKSVEAQLKGESGPDAVRQRRVIGNRASAEVTALRKVLRTWYDFYVGYDPLFTWWAAEPFKASDSALQTYAAFLRERVAGLKPLPQAPGTGASEPPAIGSDAAAIAGAKPGASDDIIGNPIGREALVNDLAFEMIPYAPEELIAIANKEFVRCEAEMRRASNEMGYGDDWKKALEKVKTMYVEPGRQPELIRALAREAEEFLDIHNLVTVPPIVRETWSMEMMTPERQLINPFFTGGDTISVSYPVAAMTYEQKMMSMRGNNVPFSRATVFHELVPGHKLQGYMAAHFRSYRAGFGNTPFLGEGWSLYWELLLYEMKFQKTPEDRVGALFWRMHRCARIIFSLSFHLGRMTPEECINFLVDRVGHERENAVGEVRRSFAGDYPPLYQAAYLLGGLQLYSLHKELVGGGRMTNRQFHDAVLKENAIPIEMIRASLTSQKLTRDYMTTWKFYGEIPVP